MSEKNAVSDNDSIGSHPYDSDMNTHSSMFKYDNDTLGFVCRTLPGYTREERKFGRLSVLALQSSWRESRVNDQTFEYVSAKFLTIIPPKKLPSEFHRLKKEFILQQLSFNSHNKREESLSRMISILTMS